MGLRSSCIYIHAFSFWQLLKVNLPSVLESMLMPLYTSVPLIKLNNNLKAHYHLFEGLIYGACYKLSWYWAPLETPSGWLLCSDCDHLQLQYQSLVGSLNWLAHTTRPDLSTVVSLLVQHQSNPLPGHLEAACFCTRYLSSTKNLGIYLKGTKQSAMETFLDFPSSLNVQVGQSRHMGTNLLTCYVQHAT